MPRRLLPLWLLLLASAAQAQFPDGEVLDTGVVRFEMFDNGELGTTVGIGTGLVFEDVNGLFEGTFLVGRSPTQVSGEAYDGPHPDKQEWVNTEPLAAVAPPPGFDLAYRTRFDDSGAQGGGPLGLAVTATAFARMGDPFVFVRFEIENASGTDLSGLHPGIFADWDLDAGISWFNMACFDKATRLLYAWDISGLNPNHYGQLTIDPPDEDHAVTGTSYDVLPGDSILYRGLTRMEPCPDVGADRRTVLGIGPIDLAAGESATVTFAFVAGGSESEILANAAAAQGLFPTAAEPPEPVGGVALLPPAPNPARSTTALSFSLDRPLPIRLSVHDALGREVAVLLDGARAAGQHRVRWDAPALPAGVYLVRLEAGGARLTQRVVLRRERP